MPSTPLVIAASTSALCLGEERCASLSTTVMSPSIFASPLIWFIIYTKNGNTKSGTDARIVRCLVAASAAAPTASAKLVAPTNSGILAKLCDHLRFPPFRAPAGKRSARAIIARDYAPRFRSISSSSGAAFAFSTVLEWRNIRTRPRRELRKFGHALDTILTLFFRYESGLIKGLCVTRPEKTSETDQP
jgi:hypothetical protein